MARMYLTWALGTCKKIKRKNLTWALGPCKKKPLLKNYCKISKCTVTYGNLR